MATSPTPSHYLQWNMITIPVKKAPCARGETSDLKMLHGSCVGTEGGDPTLGRRWECRTAGCGKVMPDNDPEIVRGYPTSEKGFLIFSKDELKSLEAEKDKAMSVIYFTPFADVDPVWLDKTYYLSPIDDAAAQGFQLLHQTLLDTGQSAIVKYRERGHDKVAVIRAVTETLMLHELFFSYEIQQYELKTKRPIRQRQFGEAELAMARQLIESNIRQYDGLADESDGYMDRLNAAIAAKLEGKEIPVTASAEAPAATNDLMAALRASLASVPAPTTKPPVKMDTPAEPATAAKKPRKSKAA